MSYTNSYKLGGLEKTKSEEEILTVGKTKYVVSDKFRSMLKDMLIDWGTFLEIYNNNLNYDNLFEQIKRLLDINTDKIVQESFIPILKQIYELPPKAHLTCLLKKFNIFEPLSVSIFELFSVVKRYFEYIVKKYVDIRNNYIIENKLKDPQNDWEELSRKWSEANETFDLGTSSLTLLFINAPKLQTNEKLKLHIEVKKIPETKDLKDAIKKYRYAGFCPKVPVSRLIKLFEFPCEEFITACHVLDKNAEFPDFEKIEESIEKLIETQKVNQPVVISSFKKEKVPEELLTKDKQLELIKWYTDHILQMRKQLKETGEMYEVYYKNIAEKIIIITDELRKHLVY